MGFLKNLFSKKNCDICGGEIGLLGNRKLEDGNCCKECARKLSPWFNDRKHSTIDEIKAQIEYREKNKEEVEKFNITRQIGTCMKLLVDENAGKFAVTEKTDLIKANPDIIDISCVTSVNLDIEESEDEVYRETEDQDGKTIRERHNPPRYKYSYNFEITISLNHPYINEIKYSLSDGYFHVRGRDIRTGSFMGIGFTQDTGMLSDALSSPPSMDDRRNNIDYIRYEEEAREIENILLRRDAYPKEELADKELNLRKEDSKHIELCPWCGSENEGGSFCENCGGKLE